MATKKPHYLWAPELGDLADFRNVLYRVHEYLRLPPPTEIQYDIAHKLQYGSRRQIIMAFRGIGKSHITAAFVCWLWLIERNFKITVLSASEERAKEFAHMVHKLLAMDLFEHLKPGKDDRNSILSFDVADIIPAKDPSLKVIGVTGMIVGGRADFVIADDIEIPKNSNTVALREKLLQITQEFTTIEKTGGRTAIKVLGTPQSENSIYFEMEKRGYEIDVWTAWFPESLDLYRAPSGRMRLAASLVKRLEADPALASKNTDARFDETTLIEKTAGKTKSFVRLQYMLDPTMSDEEKYPLKLRDLQVMPFSDQAGPVNLFWMPDRAKSSDLENPEKFPLVGLNGDRYYRPFTVSPDFVPYEDKILYIDPAGMGKDEVGWGVLYLLKGNIFARKVSGRPGGYSKENLEFLADRAGEFKVNKIVVERNFGDGMFAQLLRPILAQKHINCAVEEIHSTGQKEVRICDTLEPVMGAHRLILHDDVIKEDYNPDDVERQSLYQLTRMTRQRGALKYDDRVDGLSLGVRYFVESMAIDAKAAQDEHDMAKREQQFEEIQRFIEEARTGIAHGTLRAASLTWVDDNDNTVHWMS